MDNDLSFIVSVTSLSVLTAALMALALLFI